MQQRDAVYADLRALLTLRVLGVCWQKPSALRPPRFVFNMTDISLLWLMLLLLMLLLLLLFPWPSATALHFPFLPLLRQLLYECATLAFTGYGFRSVQGSGLF